jgi:tRNA nucleotidyltransferase (CCA-adding enzyme)
MTDRPTQQDGLDCYEVGGAVRDALLGLPVNDRDWVVVGATPERMVALGFRPVGRDFPVFLHPVTREEYALARTERKSGRGYRGFVVHCAPEVTLEEDLRRRDLTINAMARARDGTLVDPWGGERDLREQVLRHVSEAFAEDPVRILRLARFAARFERFTIAPATTALMRAMVVAGEVDALVPERVWQEIARGLGERTPSRMFAVLHGIGALARLLPDLDRCWGPAAAAAVDRAARCDAPLAPRFATLLHGLEPDAVLRTCERLRAPNDCRDLARRLVAEQASMDAALRLDAAGMLALLERCDAIRQPGRFEALLCAYEASRPGRGAGPDPARNIARLRRAVAAARSVDAGAIAAETLSGVGTAPVAERIRVAVQSARERAIADADRIDAPPSGPR